MGGRSGRVGLVRSTLVPPLSPLSWRSQHGQCSKPVLVRVVSSLFPMRWAASRTLSRFSVTLARRVADVVRRAPRGSRGGRRRERRLPVEGRDTGEGGSRRGLDRCSRLVPGWLDEGFEERWRVEACVRGARGAGRGQEGAAEEGDARPVGLEA